MRRVGRRWARILVWAVALIATAPLACRRTTAGDRPTDAAPARGGIPCGPNAFTEEGLDQVRMAWYGKLVPDAYAEVGLRNPAWDDAARRLVEQHGAFLRAKDEADKKRLLDLVQPAIAARCEDPLVLYLIGLAFAVNDRPVEAEPYLLRSVEGFGKTPYPRCVALLAPLRLVRVCLAQAGDKARKSTRWVDVAVAWIGEASAERVFADKEQRVLWEQFDGHEALDCRMKAVAEAIRSQPNADPWLREMATGSAGIEAAWQARGGGWADTVTDEGWKTFARELRGAYGHLVEAWKLHPDYPEAPTELIRVAMGGEAGRGETPRLWFDRAVAGQFDYWPAYSALLMALLPRWGGSHDAMYQFGLECLATKRFDTVVPEVLFTAVWEMSEGDGATDIWTQADVYDNLRTLYEGILADPTCVGTRRDTVTTAYAAVAWRCGEFQDARRLLDQLGNRGDSSVVQKMFRVPLVRVRHEVYKATGGSPTPAASPAAGP